MRPVSAAGLALVVDTISDANLTACTSVADDCSLRGAINAANSAGGGNTISFDGLIFYFGGTIVLGSDLPTITSTLTISDSTFSNNNASTGQGAASGTGDLCWWDQNLNNGLGDWALAQSGVSFTINFYESGQKGKGKKPTGADTFGISIQYTPVSPPQPNKLPNSDPQTFTEYGAVARGNIPSGLAKECHKQPSQ